LATILVADDDASLRDSVTDILNNEGYSVLQAADGEEALGVLSQQPVDVLLLDLAMPKLDGVAVLEALKPPLPKIILLSAFSYYSIDDIDRRGFGGKVTRALQKPYPPVELIAAVREAITELGGGE